jgi:hypothetical protein
VLDVFVFSLHCHFHANLAIIHVSLKGYWAIPTKNEKGFKVDHGVCKLSM